jgi:3-isopropylmalate dehydrogenase
VTHRIAVIRGDGTGPEVVAEGLKVLEAVRDGFDVELTDFDLGADRYLRTSRPSRTATRSSWGRSAISG